MHSERSKCLQVPKPLPCLRFSLLFKLFLKWVFVCICMYVWHILYVYVLSRFSRVQLLPTLCTIARQAPLSMGFSRQEYWSGLPCPPPGDLPYPGIEPMSLACLLHWQVGSVPLCLLGIPICLYTHTYYHIHIITYWSLNSTRLGVPTLGMVCL